MKKRYLLIDGHGLAFRGFYALPPMSGPDGTPTNAIAGFFNMLLKARGEWSADETVIFFDPHGPTVRDEMYAEYKDGRAPAPDEFKVQMPLIIELARLLGYPVFIRDGVEADDMIASTAAAIEEGGGEALILSADKDLMQVLRGHITMVRPTKGVSEFKLFDEHSFREAYGFEPRAMADYLAIVGDSADNIPGVAGIGDKGARALLQKYGSLDEIYRHIAELPKGTAAKLEAGRDAAEMSMSLVLPQPTEPIPFDEMVMREVDERAAPLLARLGMKKLAERVGVAPGDAPSISVVRVEAGGHVPFAEIVGEDLLAAVPDGDGFAVMSRGGSWASVGVGELAPWLGSGDRRVILTSARALPRDKRMPDELAPRIFDAALAHYYLHPDAKAHTAFDALGLAEMPERAADICAALLTAYSACEASGHFADMRRVMSEIDSPLVPVLERLGEAGLFVDAGAMERLRREIASDAARIEREICEAAGGVINLNSPKQVGELLFERLHLPIIKKTKTGASTDAEVLEQLARLPGGLGRVPAMLIEYRESSKMLAGFVEPFIRHLDESRDGRIHSTFLHDATGTGRLASRDPNVQNLPVFGARADDFRRAIRPGGGDRLFVAADYSQIELRVLARLSGEERLIEAFADGADIHRETAAWVFDVEPDDVSAEQRRFAKTVNFGLIYGMSAHGLAARMGISRPEASNMIDRYFSVLPSVKRYLRDSAAEAKSRGYTLSAFGRIRPLAEVSTVEGRGNSPIDRVAVNTPIQSAASDIAKIAMIRFDAELRRRCPDASLVLQVHDSLVCECPAKDADSVTDLLVSVMESVDFPGIPLKADAKRGPTLADV